MDGLPFSVQNVLDPKNEPQLKGTFLTEFAGRVRDALALHGLTAAEVAQRCALSRSTVSWAVRGIMATQSTVEALERALSIDASDLVAGRERIRFQDSNGEEWVLAKLREKDGGIV